MCSQSKNDSREKQQPNSNTSPRHSNSASVRGNYQEEETVVVVKYLPSSLPSRRNRRLLCHQGGILSPVQEEIAREIQIPRVGQGDTLHQVYCVRDGVLDWR